MNLDRFPFSYATENYESPWSREEREAAEENKPMLESENDLLGVVNCAIDAMRVTQRLFQLSDGHILMTACKALTEAADKLESGVRPSWWPECPWPEDVWPMTEEQYVAAIPDPNLRTALSGFLMRRGWLVASYDIQKRMEEAQYLRSLASPNDQAHPTAAGGTGGAQKGL